MPRQKVSMEVNRIVVESSSPFVFTAVCAYLDSLCSTGTATVLALRPREPDFLLFTLAHEEGSVTFQSHTVMYRVETGQPLSTDNKPEPFRQVHLATSSDRDVLLDLVRVAVDRHRWRVTAPRGQQGMGVMRHVFDDDAQCWDSGKLVPHRSLETLFLPSGVLEDLLCDLQSYLRQETLDTYAALHIAPIRIYMLHGKSGCGKTATIQCLASATQHNLAILNFNVHTTDQDVAAALRALPPKCFLCIEDIDCLFDARANKNHGVTFASLLAALDGVNASTALTVFLTTNSLEALDTALRRRVDYTIEYTWATKNQCARMFAAFYPHSASFETVWAHVSKHTFSTSLFQKFLVRTLHAKDPLACLDSFDALLHCTHGNAHARPTSMYL